MIMIFKVSLGTSVVLFKSHAVECEIRVFFKHDLFCFLYGFLYPARKPRQVYLHTHPHMHTHTHTHTHTPHTQSERRRERVAETPSFHPFQTIISASKGK